MKKLLLIYSVFFLNTLSAQHIYKDRKFFGGSFYINSNALKDITINGNSTDKNGDEYWNNSPYVENQGGKDSEIRAKFRTNITYGYFPMDNFAIGGNFKVSSNSFNKSEFRELYRDTLYLISNKSLDISFGPFLRYYIEIGAQPYEIGAIFIEGAYHYGGGDSKDNVTFDINDSTSFSFTDSYSYSLSIIKAKVGFCWYLSDFISHNWFTGSLLALEPSISYNWTTKNNGYANADDKVQKYRGISINLALISYF